MGQHRRDHELLLQEVLAGDRTESDAQFVLLLEECDDCRRQWAGFGRTLVSLSAARTEQDIILKGLLTGAEISAAGTERVHGMLERLRSEKQVSKKGPASRRVIAMLALVAASVIIIFSVRALRPGHQEVPLDSGLRDLELGAESALEFLPPVLVDGELEISWIYDQKFMGTYVLLVYDPTRAGDKAIWRSLSLQNSPCSVPSDVFRNWPKSIQLEVELLDSDAQFVDSFWGPSLFLVP